MRASLSEERFQVWSWVPSPHFRNPHSLSWYKHQILGGFSSLCVPKILSKKFTPMLFLRPGEIRHMECAEVNWEGYWNVPTDKVKMRSVHVVPLPKQAIAILRELEPITGRNSYVIPVSGAVVVQCQKMEFALC